MTPEFYSAFHGAAVAVGIFMLSAFMVSLIRKRSDGIDIAWGLGFILLAWYTYLYRLGPNTRGLVVTILVTVWGLRLATHIFLRQKGKSEDFRYAQWRKDWGKSFIVRSFFQIYLLQAVLMLVVALPIIVINTLGDGPMSPLDTVGILLWMTGFLFETIGDYQLAEFMKQPKNKGKLMTSGLWRYTRHPNYFGEVTLWWGIGFMALAVPLPWLSLIGPLTITVLILFVSGIPMLEKKYDGRADFEQYKKKTSAFFPLPPND